VLITPVAHHDLWHLPYLVENSPKSDERVRGAETLAIAPNTNPSFRCAIMGAEMSVFSALHQVY
jgi:hypothetical protein